eukprot:3661600-Amphidinium_carterae.1
MGKVAASCLEDFVLMDCIHNQYHTEQTKTIVSKSFGTEILENGSKWCQRVELHERIILEIVNVL